jgi:hypothetical protein
LGRSTEEQESHGLTEEMISKIDEQRKWKNVNNEGVRRAPEE